MGLEAFNLFFQSGERVKHIIQLNSGIKHLKGNKYVLNNENEFWIDIELQSDYTLTIRITLCNPEKAVLLALDNLLSFVFGFKNGLLYNQDTKEKFNIYDQEAREKIIESFMVRKKIFESMYGSFTAAIGSEEFYKIQGEQRGNVSK